MPARPRRVIRTNLKSLALAATLSGTGALLAPAIAASAAIEVSATDTHEYALAAGNLDGALVEIGRKSGMPIAFERARVRSLKSSPVQGKLTAAEALEQALKGTQLRAVPSDDGKAWVIVPEEGDEKSLQTV